MLKRMVNLAYCVLNNSDRKVGRGYEKLGSLLLRSLHIYVKYKNNASADKGNHEIGLHANLERGRYCPLGRHKITINLQDRIREQLFRVNLEIGMGNEQQTIHVVYLQYYYFLFAKQINETTRVSQPDRRGIHGSINNQ